jgi:hypothetical protein
MRGAGVRLKLMVEEVPLGLVAMTAHWKYWWYRRMLQKNQESSIWIFERSQWRCVNFSECQCVPQKKSWSQSECNSVHGKIGLVVRQK